MSPPRVKKVSSVGVLNHLYRMEVVLAIDTEADQVLLLRRILRECSHQVDNNSLEGIYLQLLGQLPMLQLDHQHHFFTMDTGGHALIA